MSFEIQKNVSLKDYNSWKVGGFAQHFALPSNVDELKLAIAFAKENNLPITPLGDGSNVLISDQGIDGLVICFKKFQGVETQETVDGQFKVVALAGTSKIDLMRCFLKKKLSPALFLSGLPGNLAGGIVMNAGVSEARTPKEFCEIVEWVEVLNFDTGKISVFQKNEIEWVYRASTGWQPGAIIRAGLAWPEEPDATIPKQVIQANKLRLSKQPLDMPSCGSTFKNPDNISAGQLIDECELKGFKIGDAQVSPKHANFIVNIGNATATDIHQVIEHVKKTVQENREIELRTEVKYLGAW